jgi:hypothetical protein
MKFAIAGGVIGIPIGASIMYSLWGPGSVDKMA